MKILAHRGWWTKAEEKNALIAFERAFALGVGIETDLRDHHGEIVISHDPPVDPVPTFKDFLDCRAASGARTPLALNIKSDGLERKLGEMLGAYADLEYFVFDMSLPATLGFRREGMSFFTRQSEFEPEPLLYEDAAGVWLDCFEREWYDDALLGGHLAAGKQLCLVSPELHGREHQAFWHRLKATGFAGNPQLMLCTDYPQQALEFFHG